MTFRTPAAITPSMDENEITERLRAMGEGDVPGPARDEHLRRIAATPVEPARPFGRAWVAAAAIVGFLAGSTGLAAAGALPDPAQDVAHDVLAVVQIEVPEGKRGPCVSAIAKSDLPKAEKKAAKDACPKGGSGGDGDDGEAPGRSGSAPGQTKHADDPCKGKPPWAGQKGLSKAEKDAMKAERAVTCGRDLDEEDDEVDEQEEDDEQDEVQGPGGEVEGLDDERQAPAEDASTTTTTAPATTTVVPSTTVAPTTTAADTTTTTG